MQTRGAATVTRTTRARVTFDHDAGEVIAERAGEALCARSHPEHELSAPARKFAAMTVPELARHLLHTRGISTTALTADTLVTRALHSTNDFSQILGSTLGRTLRRACAEAPNGARQLVRQTTAKDFRDKKAIMRGAAPALAKVLENAEFTYGTIDESAESYKVETFGKIFGISRQALVNVKRAIFHMPASRCVTSEALMARKAGPTAQNAVKKNPSMRFNFAIRAALTAHNPARAAERRKENPNGYHTWTEAEIERYLATHGPGTKARLALMIFLCTGASRQDAARLGWQNVSAGRIRDRRGKTGGEADLPILPELAEELRHVSADAMLFLTHGQGRPCKPESLGNWFKAQCNAAGLPHCSAHGLRKAGARRIAERGGTEGEVICFMAHATPKEGATYTKKASHAHGR